MLTDIGVPVLIRVHKATFWLLQAVGAFEDYLHRWRDVLGYAEPGLCPCGCLA